MNYQDKRWKRARDVRLRKDEYLCQECKRYGKSIQATEVHHILPADECTGRYERLKYDNRNLISLCGKCHKQMHVSWRKELSDKGYALLRRKGILEVIK